MNYKSADGTEQGHEKIDALCCELGNREERRGEERREEGRGEERRGGERRGKQLKWGRYQLSLQFRSRKGGFL